MDRRYFLKTSAGTVLTLSLGSLAGKPLWAAPAGIEPPFKISLAQWSLNRQLFGGKLDNLDFAKKARELGFDAIEYVNQFFKDKARDNAYLSEMKKRAADLGVQSVLIMCDGEGGLGDPDDAKRTVAVENHYKWVEAAKFLGCHSIRVNAHSEGSFDEQMARAADGLRRLSEFAAPHKMNVIVENHGGLSSNGQWLAGVMKRVNLPNCGTLPDFGNFHGYDRYLGTEELMPFAKGVSGKSHAFDAQGNEVNSDFFRLMRIVRDSGYTGYVDVEYEGSELSEEEGILATRKLLERVRDEQVRCQPLFNGKDLDGWVAEHGGEWTVQDGVLIGKNGNGWTNSPEQFGSWLRTARSYGDFRLELQYSISEKGNSGIMLRSAKEKNPAFTGYEMQIYDAPGAAPSKHGPAAIYDVVAPTKNLVRPSGQWNTVTVIAKGDSLTFQMNGETVLETIQTRSSQGYIGLQSHDDKTVVQFKNIRLETF